MNVGPPPAEDQLEEVRTAYARLAARGLVRVEPSVQVRDVAVVEEDNALEQPPPHEWGIDGDDEVVLEPAPRGPTAATRCPGCRTTQQVVVDATGYRCVYCDKVWRWAICITCCDLSLTLARQESWRCRECGAYSRSWWRTATASSEAHEVTVGKRADFADHERELALTVTRRRRWRLIVAGVVALFVIGASALVFSFMGLSSPVAQSRATCVMFTDLKSDIANGALSAGEVQAQLTALAASAEAATPDIQLATDSLASSGRPGDAAFLVASTQLSNACAVRP